MKKLLSLLILLAILTWAVRTNHLSLGSATDLLRKVNSEMETKGEMEVVAKAVQEHYAKTGQFPSTSQQVEKLLANYLTERHKQVGTSTGVDRWGTRYLLVPRKGSFDVVSAGPDKQWRTADDITLTRFFGGSGEKPRPPKPAPSQTPR